MVLRISWEKDCLLLRVYKCNRQNNIFLFYYKLMVFRLENIDVLLKRQNEADAIGFWVLGVCWMFPLARRGASGGRYRRAGPFLSRFKHSVRPLWCPQPVALFLIRLNILVLGGSAGFIELYAYGMFKIARVTGVSLPSILSTLFILEYSN